MDTTTAKRLCEINTTFYAEQASSFASTRAHPWHGWSDLAILRDISASGSSPFAVFDLACGNLRFESYLTEELPAVSFAFYAVDNCTALIPQTPVVDYQCLDVIELLGKGLILSEQFTAPLCDLSVCFGFMHHVPLPAWRASILSSLIAQTRRGGTVVVSFWQFLNNDALAHKAQDTHQRALAELQLSELEQGDYLLGWQDTPGVYRYCHSFSEDEIDHLAASVAGKACVLSRFTRDGRTDNLNTYLVLQVL
jgi:SAM-dependent methyltransferase